MTDIVTSPAKDNTSAAVSNAAEAPAEKPVVEANPQEGEVKTEADTPKAETPPESKTEEVVYDLKMPEGLVVAPETLEGVTDLARNLNLSNEQAQEVMNFGAKMLAKWGEQMAEFGQKQSQEWRSELESDPEIGGARLKSTEQAVAKVRDVIFPTGSKERAEFDAFMNETGIGNAPILNKLFARLRAYVGDDTLVSGDPSPNTAPKSLQDHLYKS